MPALDFSDPEIRNLGAVLREYARKSPRSVCLMSEDARFTFAEVNEAANRVANTLSAMGVRKGDRVVIFMRSRIEYVELVFGINKLGAIWVPINADYKGEWLLEADRKFEHRTKRLVRQHFLGQRRGLPLRQLLPNSRKST